MCTCKCHVLAAHRVGRRVLRERRRAPRARLTVPRVVARGSSGSRSSARGCSHSKGANLLWPRPRRVAHRGHHLGMRCGQRLSYGSVAGGAWCRVERQLSHCVHGQVHKDMCMRAAACGCHVHMQMYTRRRNDPPSPPPLPNAPTLWHPHTHERLGVPELSG